MKRLEERAAAIAQRAQLRALRGIELAMLERHIDTEVQEGRIVLSGRRLVQRWLRDASLRFVTGLLK